MNNNSTSYDDLKVYVINLADHHEKRDRMKKELSKFSFKYEFFNAFDGRNLNKNDFYGYNDFKRKLFLGRSLFPSELGALESNRSIYKKILQENISRALILEDDISFNDKFEFYLKKIIKHNCEWEIIRFIDNNKIKNAKGRKIAHLGNNHYLKRFPKLYGGSHAYLINKSGAQKMLSQMNNFYHHIDIIMGQVWKKNLNSLICSPGLVWQIPELNVSPTDHPRFKKREKTLFSIYPLSRFFFKIYESSAKWIFYLLKYPKDKNN